MTVAVDAEITALMLCLLRQQNHVLGAVEGLSDEALRPPCCPLGRAAWGWCSTSRCRWSVCGSALFVAGDPEVIEQVGSQASAWQVDPGLPAADVLDSYSREASLVDAVIAPSSADADLAWWPFPGSEWRLHNLRDVLLHVITETACHAGHLDAVRELIDGQQWLVNT